MSADEWIPKEAAIRHVARALKCSDVHRPQESWCLRSPRAAIAVIDREGYLPHRNPVESWSMEPFERRSPLLGGSTSRAEFPLPGATKAEAPTPEEPPKHARGRRPADAIRLGPERPAI